MYTGPSAWDVVLEAAPGVKALSPASGNSAVRTHMTTSGQLARYVNFPSGVVLTASALTWCPGASVAVTPLLLELFRGQLAKLLGSGDVVVRTQQPSLMSTFSPLLIVILPALCVAFLGVLCSAMCCLGVTLLGATGTCSFSTKSCTDFRTQ